MYDILSSATIDKLSSSIYNVEVLNCVPSTNTYLLDLARNGAVHESVVIANSQTNGKGRLGRSFFSPEGTGIYMSVLLNAAKIKLPVNMLTIAAGVAVCRTLTEITEAPPLIKWVNDIFLNGKKVCGILAETQTLGSNIQHVVVGIGLNLFTLQCDFPEDIKNIAASVMPKNISRNEVIAKILNNLKVLYDCNNLSTLIDEYKSYSLVLEKTISFKRGETEFLGIATDIDQNGGLVVKLDDGSCVTLNCGEVTLGSQNFIE